MSKDGTAALPNSTVDGISQGVCNVDISNNDVSAAAAASECKSREEDTISEKKCTSCEQKLEYTNKVDASAIDNDVPICGNCGKEGANNTCNKCKQVKYCNAACKKKHKTKHKKQCERRVAELHDIELFKQPPPEEDCSICFLRLPTLGTGKKYQTCCGKRICSGCIHAVEVRDADALCPFCRIPTPQSFEELVERLRKRVDVGDAHAISSLGDYYYGGVGMSQDHTKALELWHQAVELGNKDAYFYIGKACCCGKGVERDLKLKKAAHYWELGAIGGDTNSRIALGFIEQDSGNIERALRHYKISVTGGNNGSFNRIKKLYSNGHVTKDEYTEALRAYQKYLNDVKSRQRDEAAAANDKYKYIE